MVENICHINYKQNENLKKDQNNKKRDVSALEKKIQMDKKKIQEKNKEIERLYTEIINLKAIFANKELEYFISVAKYNNLFKSIKAECRRFHISFDINLSDL